MDNLFLHHNKLDELILNNDYSAAARILLREQLKVWPELEEAYNSVKNVRIKNFQFDGFVIKVQHNPRRLTSSSAKVDEESVKIRPCFLCEENLYSKQKAIKYKVDFLILVNPFPIFPEHFTIPHREHIPQSIKEWFGKMLFLSKDMPRDVVIYNGSRCGASAPDHLHFQAGSKFFMPIDDEFFSLKNEYGEILFEDDELIVGGINDGLRKFISIEAKEIPVAESAFELFYNFYIKISDGTEEPMMNIISFYEPGKNENGKNYGWRILIFLREKHRPSFYYLQGKDNIIWSPASIDLGGLCITPLEKDFDALTEEKLSKGFNEITISSEKFSYLKAKIKALNSDNDSLFYTLKR